MDQELLKMGQEGLKIVFWTKETPFLSKKNKTLRRNWPWSLPAMLSCYHELCNWGAKRYSRFYFFLPSDDSDDMMIMMMVMIHLPHCCPVM